MPLTGTGDILGDTIRGAIDDYVAGLAGAPLDRTAMFHAMGNAIISHIIAFGLNAITVTVASVSGVVSGPSASGPGVGTGSIT